MCLEVQQLTGNGTEFVRIKQPPHKPVKRDRKFPAAICAPRSKAQFSKKLLRSLAIKCADNKPWKSVDRNFVVLTDITG